MTIRLILLIPLLAYVGFLWAGQGSRSFNSNTIIGVLLGAVLGCCLASSLLAEQGASALKFRICLNRRAYFDVCGGSFVLHIKWKIGNFGLRLR